MYVVLVGAGPWCGVAENLRIVAGVHTASILSVVCWQFDAYVGLTQPFAGHAPQPVGGTMMVFVVVHKRPWTRPHGIWVLLQDGCALPMDMIG